jgi:hypothetical protein
MHTLTRGGNDIRPFYESMMDKSYEKIMVDPISYLYDNQLQRVLLLIDTNHPEAISDELKSCLGILST